MYPHRIRLRGPWEAEAPPRRVAMPCSWAEAGLTGQAGRARFRRNFGYPGRIDAHERVVLVVEGAEAARAWLNGSEVAVGQAAEADVTALLKERNALLLEVAVAGDRPWEEVALEVRCAAHLRGVRFEPGPEGLAVTGEVVGPAGPELELYVICDRSPSAYATISPAPEGRPFRLVVPPERAAGAATAQIDLVNGATVWYTIQQELARPSAGPGA
jgi:hypothetical protein